MGLGPLCEALGGELRVHKRNAVQCAHRAAMGRGEEHWTGTVLGKKAMGQGGPHAYADSLMLCAATLMPAALMLVRSKEATRAALGSAGGEQGSKTAPEGEV
eukprot:scaffold266072_cov23-Tisochrysis_lutea.AAC.1